MLESSFRPSKDSEPEKERNVEEPMLDAIDIEAKEIAEEVKRKAEETNGVARFVSEETRKFIQDTPDVYDESMTLKEFKDGLGESDEDPTSRNVLIQIKRIEGLYPGSFDESHELRFFLRALDRKIAESEKILHPEKESAQ